MDKMRMTGMRSRLNDTASIVSTPLGEGEERTISVKKLEGEGYLVRSSSWNMRTGQSKSSEVFHESEPRLITMAGTGSQDAAGSKGLKDTAEYLGFSENKLR